MYVDDIEIFGKNEKKRTKKPYKNDKNIEPGYSNGTWDWNMSPAHNGKGKEKNNKRNKTSETGNIKRFAEKENYMYLRILKADTIKQRWEKK